MVVDTQDWLLSISEQLSGGREDACEFGHKSHDTMDISIHFPTFAKFRVFNWFRYETSVAGWCTGKDEVSKGLTHAGAWELAESRLIASILNDGVNRSEGVVLDFGSHVGWYSMLAGHYWHPCLAIDASYEHLAVLGFNAPRALRCRGWIDENSPVIEPNGTRVRLLKVDLESKESDALRVCGKLLEDELVDAVLMEVTPPDFGPAETLNRLGFKSYLADRSHSSVAELVADEAVPVPLGQHNYLFVK